MVGDQEFPQRNCGATIKNIALCLSMLHHHERSVVVVVVVGGGGGGVVVVVVVFEVQVVVMVKVGVSRSRPLVCLP